MFRLGFRPRRAVGVAAYRSRDTKSKSQGERFADRARYGVLYYCALNTAMHPCMHAGVPNGGAV